MFTREIKVTHGSVKNTNTKTFGGYKMYFKLFSQGITMAKSTNILTKRMYLSLLCQTLFKPLKQFYSHTTLISGDYEVYNGNFNNISLVKKRTHRLFKISCYINHPKLTHEDINEILK